MQYAFFGAALSAALLAGCAAQSTPAIISRSTPAESAAPLNIGFVLYTRSDTPGTLNARWNYANAYSGPGVATGGPLSGDFAGRYHVRYFFEDGAFSDEYDLDIERHSPGEFYHVTWIVEGEVRARGVGMEVADGNGLAVGWRRVED